MAAARCRQPRCRVAEGAIEPLLPDRGQKKIMKRCCVRRCNSKSNCSLTGVPVPVPARAAQRRVLCPCWPRAATRSRRRGQSIWRQGRRTRWQHPAAAEQHGRSVRASMRRMADLCDVAVLMAGRAHVLVVARARSGAATRGQWCDHSLSLHTCACGGRAAPTPSRAPSPPPWLCAVAVAVARWPHADAVGMRMAVAMSPAVPPTVPSLASGAPCTVARLRAYPVAHCFSAPCCTCASARCWPRVAATEPGTVLALPPGQCNNEGEASGGKADGLAGSTLQP